jgi:hypothetical protein
MAREVRLSPDGEWQAAVDADIGIVTTLGRDASPISLTLSIVARNRLVSVSRPRKTARFARLRHDPGVAFLVESRTRCGELRADHPRREEGVLKVDALTEEVAGAFEQKFGPSRTASEDMPVHTWSRDEIGHTAIEITSGGRILSRDNADRCAVEPT